MRTWRRVTPTSGPTSRSPGSGTGRSMTGEPPRVVTAGETMALVVPTAPGRLRHAAHLTLSSGGAESTVAGGPPLATRTATVTRAMLETVTTRRPAKTTGMASG